VLIIPLQTLLATSVFHVQTHREPRALTGLLLPEWHCKSRKEAKWKLVRRWIYRFVVILQHRTARPTSKQMVKQTHFQFVYLFCPNSRRVSDEVFHDYFCDISQNWMLN
jgi:hypothetical protein